MPKKDMPKKTRNFAGKPYQRKGTKGAKILDASKSQYSSKQRGKNARLHQHKTGEWYVYTRERKKRYR